MEGSGQQRVEQPMVEASNDSAASRTELHAIRTVAATFKASAIVETSRPLSSLYISS